MEQTLLIKPETKIICKPWHCKGSFKGAKNGGKTEHANVDQKLLSQKTNPKHSVMRHEEEEEEEEEMWTTDKKECPQKKHQKEKELKGKRMEGKEMGEGEGRKGGNQTLLL